MENPHDISGNLLDWNEVKDREGWSGILIGNGASIAVWDDFLYSSIYNKSRSEDIENPLSDLDIQLFDTLRTTNFERVLSSLSTARIINNALNIAAEPVQSRYNSIQTSLIQAVRAVHVPWRTIPEEVLVNIQENLLNYKFVYSTNYDLLIYWAMMHKGNSGGFKDYFWGEQFDVSNTQIWNKATCVLYLHGGLHIYRLPSGQTLKRRADNGQNLLDLFGQTYQGDAVPLFITEGTSEEKLSSIYRSDYLSFAFSQFSKHEGPLVMFGHSLGESDNHIVSTIANWGPVKIAISLLPGSETNIRRLKAQIIAKLPEAKLFFFDASTHPLGSPALKIPSE